MAYPDCRDNASKAMQIALNVGMDSRFVIQTPLMWIGKLASWRMAETLDGDALVDLVRRNTHTCYECVRDVLHDWGHGCGKCRACELRREGYCSFAKRRSGVDTAS